MRRALKASLFTTVTIIICLAVFSSASADELHYFYDNVGRLTRVVSGSDGQLYKYDKVGNLLSTVTDTTSPNPPLLESINPDYLFIGSSVITTISGQNLLTLNRVTSDNAALIIKVLEVYSDEQIKVEITAPIGASTGPANITCSNLYGSSSISIFVAKLIFSPGQFALTPGSTSSITAGTDPLIGKSLTLSLNNDNPSIVSVPSGIQIPLSGETSFNVNALAEGVATIESLNIRSVIFVTQPFSPEPSEAIMNNAGLISVLIDQPTLVSSSLATGPVSAYIDRPLEVSSSIESGPVSAYIDEPSAVSSSMVSELVSVGVDTTLPTGTIVINEGAASTNNSVVTLTLSCSDDIGCSQMQLSNDNTAWSAAETYGTTKVWTLTPGDGEKTVYAKFSDLAGNLSSACTDTIIASGIQPTIRTVTVKPSGGDYTSLNAVLTAESADLVALNRILYIECYAMQDTAPVSLTGFTTDADHYIRIYTPASERHQGKWDTSKYRIETTGQAINIAANYVRIEGLQIQVTASSGNNANGIKIWDVVGVGDIWISHCIIKGVLSGTVTYTDGISNAPDTATVVRIFNNLFLDWNRSGAGTFIGGVYTSIGTAYYFNNTFINCYQGIYRDGGSVIARNNLMYSCNQPAGGVFDASTDYNATNNGTMGYTVTGSGNVHDRISQSFTFVDAANGDYHLAAGDAGAKDHGVSDPGSGLYSDDIDGQARQTVWDIGADEYIASGMQPTIRTVTVKPSGGNYTSLNAALTAESADLVALNRILYIECYAMQDTTAVNLTGFTTDADHYIRIYTPASERHQGKWDTSKYRIETTGQAINIAANYVRIEGLQIQVTASSGTNANGISTANVVGAGDIRISHSIIKGVLSGTVTYSDGVSNGPETNTVVRIFNNLFLDWNRSGAGTFIGGVYTSIGTPYYFNNTLVNCYQGMYQNGGSVIAKNNLMYLCNQPAGGTFDAGTDYNATNNASMGYTVTGGGNTHDRISQTFTFVNEASGDYHLAASDAGAKDHGVSDPGSGLFSDDTDAQARQALWDIGADEAL